jgi:superfamily II DNA or RNA helicase
MRNAYYRLGLSGSPVGRSDKRDAHVISHFGQIVHTISYREMAEIGRVATGRVQLIDCPQTLGGSYSSGGYQANIVTSKVRNGKVLQLWATCPKPCITFVKEIAHGERLMKAAARMNLTAAFVHGDVPDSERRRILANVDAGNIQVLIASPAIKQAVDIVHLRCGINACGGREVIGSIQRIGRPGRVCRAGQNGKCLICTTAGQKTEFVWYDFKDYDPIAAKRDDWLRRHASIRAEALRGKGYTVEEP